eukprot:CAMPEP_0194423994 /NCGR_PEP_ID=MMETSP0176-20130528/23253_1 /TAXON_ID=216777 /ORGANISM="Proboscia alata, Strain PI-D3" /LENGTH=287 /DNA_ID=CAMNT_0039233503 /DNA_START=184 /DNA_END=1044 /DNA_ORIENTATION=+
MALGDYKQSKTRIIDEGALRSLLEMARFPDQEIQRCAGLAINCLVLGTEQEPKTAVMNGEGISPLLLRLQHKNSECIHHAICCLGSLRESDEVKANLVEMKSIELIIPQIHTGSIEIKRAVGYFFAKLAESSEFYDKIASAGGLEGVISLASLVDSEYQDYTTFALAFLASNREYQVKLVKIGAVHPLVSIMATNSEPKHYTGLALLKLADNFENHITIAKEGGIEALLRLGRNRVTDEELQYKAALTAGQLASNAVNIFLPDELEHFFTRTSKSGAVSRLGMVKNT